MKTKNDMDILLNKERRKFLQFSSTDYAPAWYVFFEHMLCFKPPISIFQKALSLANTSSIVRVDCSCSDLKWTIIYEVTNYQLDFKDQSLKRTLLYCSINGCKYFEVRSPERCCMYAVSTECRSASNPGYTSSRYQLNDMHVVNRDFSSRNKIVVLSNHCFKK